jgi:hypothetical protein
MSIQTIRSDVPESPLGRTVADVLAYLKMGARSLHKQVSKDNSQAIARLRAHPGFASLTDSEVRGETRRRHCLSVIALELGFRGWAQLAHVLEDGGDGADFGTILCPKRMMPHQNIWVATYSEAKQIRAEHGGFLLGYRKQFFIADGDYLQELGLDPEAEGWEAMERDWITPGDLNARARFYARLFAERLPASTKP